MKIIAIEANIGAGKSTLLKPLKQELELWSGESWEILIEPVDEDPEFHRLLKDMIRDMTNPDKRIVFQMYLTNQRQNMLKDLPDGNYIVERSLFSDLVFSQMYFLETEKPSAEYMHYYYNIKEKLKDYPQIDLVVYLDRDPEACLESIEKRGREGETYELGHLEDLKRFHDACLPQIARKYNTELLTINLDERYANPAVVVCDVMEALYG